MTDSIFCLYTELVRTVWGILIVYGCFQHRKLARQEREEKEEMELTTVGQPLSNRHYLRENDGVRD